MSCLRLFGLLVLLVVVCYNLVEAQQQQQDAATTNNNRVKSYKGIQYATVPERFAPSEVVPFDADSLSDVDRYIAYGPKCYQPTFGGPPPGVVSDGEGGGPSPPQGPLQSEECLFLNIWHPLDGNNTEVKASSSLVPVMVWIHGGGFFTGSGSEPVYDGTKLVASSSLEEGVVVVTLNYRLGVFGLLVTDEETGAGGMNAIGDQIVALQWIQQNIETFGGDPNRVTIFGESIGGVCVCLLSISPTAKGLFSRSIIQSGQCITERLTPLSKVNGFAKTQQLLDDNNLTLSELQSMPAAQLLQVAGMSFSQATLDDTVLATPPLEVYSNLQGDSDQHPINPTEIMIGSTTVDDPSMLGFPPPFYVQVGNQFESYLHETFGTNIGEAIYEKYDPRLNEEFGSNNVSAYAHFQGDFLLRCGTRHLAGLLAAASESTTTTVYLYVFGHYTANDIGNGIIATANITNTTYWAAHTTEIPFVFGNLNYTYLGPATTTDHSKDDLELSQLLMQNWISFATSGIPASQDWTSVLPDSELSDLDSFMFHGGNSRLERLSNKQLQCDTIPSFGGAFDDDTNDDDKGESVMPTDADGEGEGTATSTPTAAPSRDDAASLYAAATTGLLRLLGVATTMLLIVLPVDLVL